MPGFQDIFDSVPQGESPFDGPLPTPPMTGDSGTSSHDLFQGGMNMLGLVPGLGGVSSLYNAGQGAVQGFDKGQYGNIDTNYQLGGGDGGDFQAPQPPSHDSLFGSQRAGNLLYGTGMSGWLGNILGQIAGGISTIGDDKIDVTPGYDAQQTFAAPMGMPDYGPQQQMVHANPINYDYGPITPPPLPDLSQPQPDQSAPVTASGPSYTPADAAFFNSFGSVPDMGGASIYNAIGLAPWQQSDYGGAYGYGGGGAGGSGYGPYTPGASSNSDSS